MRFNFRGNTSALSQTRNYLIHGSFSCGTMPWCAVRGSERWLKVPTDVHGSTEHSKSWHPMSMQVFFFSTTSSQNFRNNNMGFSWTCCESDSPDGGLGIVSSLGFASQQQAFDRCFKASSVAESTVLHRHLTPFYNADQPHTGSGKVNKHCWRLRDSLLIPSH